ncbi:MAG: Gfo/Idh/MocA family oxidoreductase [Nitriliruptor sp.]
MTTTPLRVGLVGAGRIARMFHLPILRDLPDVRLVGVCDPDPGARRTAAEMASGAAATADLAELLADGATDALVICSPPSHHRGAVEAALEAGRHVYVEKPLAVTLTDAVAARDAARARPELVAATGFNVRFHPAVRGAFQRLREGQLGDLVAVRGVMTSSPRELPGWKRDRATGGGALLDLASHHVDLVRHLLDEELVSVSARLRTVRTPDDTAVVQATTASGVPVQLLVSSSSPQRDQLELVGTSATAQVDRMASHRVHLHRDLAPTSTLDRLRTAKSVAESGLRGTAERLRPPAEPSFAAALRAFVAAASRQAPWRGADLGDGLASLRVIDAAARSAAGHGQPVTLTGDPSDTASAR